MSTLSCGFICILLLCMVSPLCVGICVWGYSVKFYAIDCVVFPASVAKSGVLIGETAF